MITFFAGLAILIVGGYLGAKVCTNAFGPDDRPTPAHTDGDGSDYVPMKKWKNSLINFLNIAGTGPILGPIQGVLFGPIAFISIPIGCIIGGAVHDYFVGMISCRENGKTVPMLVRKFLGNPAYFVFLAIFLIGMMLVITVFTYTPADLTISVVHDSIGLSSPTFSTLVYAVIIIYFLLSAVLPIDKVIGKIYPLFGMMLILVTFAIFIGLFFGGYGMAELFGSWTLNGFDFAAYFTEMHFVPVFFITVACGILSGFHATQVCLVSRTLDEERDGTTVFHTSMVVEGFVAMIWAAGTMAMIGIGAADSGITMVFENGAWAFTTTIDGTVEKISATTVVYVIGSKVLGTFGGVFAAVACILLPITSGDTAIRAVRMTMMEITGAKVDSVKTVFMYTLPIVILLIIALTFVKIFPDGFHRLWMYFALFNQQMAVFALAMIVVYFIRRGMMKTLWIPAVPFVFYCFVTVSYLFGADICLGAPWWLAYTVAVIAVVAMIVLVIKRGRTDDEGQPVTRSSV